MADSLERAFPSMRRVGQINSSHCGPAAVRMLLSYVGVGVLQKEIVAAAEVGSKIGWRGMLVEEMARAVRKLAPEVEFWSKEKSTLGELGRVVNEYKHPAGVEWQGMFLPEHQDEDEGHYCVVTRVDLVNNVVAMADPYYCRRYPEDREFTVAQFGKRWWDINLVTDEESGRDKEVVDERVMFVVVLKGKNWPEELGMTRG